MNNPPMPDLFKRNWGSKSKSFYEVMKTDDFQSVYDQFGWVPTSVITHEARLGYKQLVGDSGDHFNPRKWGVGRTSIYNKVKYSQFSVHLAEVILKYWSIEGDLVVDPFAGRATRGIMARTLGRKYQGYEVALETFRQTREKIEKLGGVLECMDGCLLAHTLDHSADLVFTCPPYHDLEKYEIAPNQLSDIDDYKDFLLRIEVCVKNVFRVLKPGKFFCWVCGDWRVKHCLRTFHCDSTIIFQRQGFNIHDLVIVKNKSPYIFGDVWRAAKHRRTVKIHEYLIVARKPEK